MPELPDLTVYVEALQRRVVGEPVLKLRVGNPFVLRTVDPGAGELAGKQVVGVERIGKRIVLQLEDGYAIVIHLMVAGRLKWQAPGAALARRSGLVALDFTGGALILVEASTKKRAALHLVRGGGDGLHAFRRGGVEPLHVTLAGWAEALRKENHTLKRALTDPCIISGIGNAYSDEILHRARLSPLKQTRTLDDEQMLGLYRAARSVLIEWIERLRTEVGEGFPAKVTAFRPEMAVHGRYGQPCPECGTKVQRIRYADNETNYCPRCQTQGWLLADRSLSRLLRSDWPRSIDELEELRAKLP
jgi:formamidopyrimidine-DNA glycosylase